MQPGRFQGKKCPACNLSLSLSLSLLIRIKKPFCRLTLASASKKELLLTKKISSYFKPTLLGSWQTWYLESQL